MKKSFWVYLILAILFALSSIRVAGAMPPPPKSRIWLLANLINTNPAVNVYINAPAGGLNENQSNTATVNVRLDKITNQAVTVNLAYSRGTATANTDYNCSTDGGTSFTNCPTQTTVAVGSLESNFIIRALADNVTDPDETVIVDISNPINATLGANTSAQTTITDAPQPPANIPTVTLVANPTIITAGGTTHLVWTTTNATSCNAASTTSFSGSRNPNGAAGENVTLSNAGNYSFSMTCAGPGGTSAPSNVTVAVSNAPNPNITGQKVKVIVNWLDFGINQSLDLSTFK